LVARNILRFARAPLRWQPDLGSDRLGGLINGYSTQVVQVTGFSALKGQVMREGCSWRWGLAGALARLPRRDRWQN